MNAVVDSHQHFWRPERGDYGWLTPDSVALYRNFEPTDLQSELTEHGIDATVLVQAAPTLAETRYLLDLAEATPWIAGVVGWVDIEAPDAVSQIDALSSEPHFVGIRPMIQDIDDPAWMLQRALKPGLRALANANKTFDALVRPRHLENLCVFAERHSDLRIIVNHGAKPDIAGGDTKAWARHMKRLARDTDVCCKLSGLVTEAGTHWRREDILPVIEILLEAFGAERLMWGSDWPVLLMAGSYADWRALSLSALSVLTETQRASVLGTNAVRFYGLSAGEAGFSRQRNSHPSMRTGRDRQVAS